jgi:hypothetical protein
MIKRCHNPGRAEYKHYGGRGIVVCEWWRTSFAAFLKDMGPRPSPTHEIERIDNDGNYEPGNCRWATRKEQMRNTSVSQKVRRDDGEVFQTIVEAAETTGVHPANISRVCRGIQKTAGGHTWAYEP